MRYFTKNKIIGMLIILVAFLLILLSDILTRNRNLEAKIKIQEDIIEIKNNKINELETVKQNMDEQFGIY
ncbi:hypothetical protein CWE04_11990 [Thomasclavelia cocleata]|uniref:Uncharacterized protein n=1 Tax=Thomasclavelia cocleata TaxID=69824 RepID=A0A1I0BN54_9FIRM|nr:hypothetical protein CWE04_11990 [Thomasclavelia cocleata]SET08118.1 hypothetical protein SAMN04489758_101187 [Thomasclavelia cocleata]